MNRAKLGFGDSDSEDEPPQQQNGWKRAAKQEPEHTIYDYDGEYEDIRPVKKPRPQGPQYISRLLEAKRVRKEDKQRLEDVKVARERELEGDKYADKLVFVTDGYKGVSGPTQPVIVPNEPSPSTSSAKAPVRTLDSAKPEATRAKSLLLPSLSPETLSEYRERYIQRII